MKAVAVYILGRNTARLTTAVITTLKSAMESPSRRLSMSRAISKEKPFAKGFILVANLRSRARSEVSANDDAVTWSQQNILLEVPFNNRVVIDDILRHLFSGSTYDP